MHNVKYVMSIIISQSFLAIVFNILHIDIDTSINLIDYNNLPAISMLNVLLVSLFLLRICQISGE